MTDSNLSYNIMIIQFSYAFLTVRKFDRKGMLVPEICHISHYIRCTLMTFSTVSWKFVK
jgi:hypothetical protein